MYKPTIFFCRFDPVIYNMLENQQSKIMGRNDSRIQSEYYTLSLKSCLMFYCTYVELEISQPSDIFPDIFFNCLAYM